jgi:hypothetical protein
MLFGGLAVATAAGSFERQSTVPVLDRSDAEPFSRSAPCVLKDGDGFRAWYWCCERWTRQDDWVHYNNVIRHARSSDGIHWSPAGDLCLSPGDGDEYALGRPWVIRDGDRYRMWFSARSTGDVTYRIGYAESGDGVVWSRDDAAGGLEPSGTGWDSDMVCHPCVVDAHGSRYLFYNGNAHGAGGFGYAVLDAD